MTTEAKDKRLQLRTTATQDVRLRRAADVEDVSVSEFVLRSAMDQADSVLADKRWFILEDQDFDSFIAALETPVDGQKLAELLTSESVFGKEFELD